MSWLRAIPFLFTLLAFALQPASASAFGNAHPEARVSAFELVALASVGAPAETSPGLHEGIAEAYDENASGYRFAARGAETFGRASVGAAERVPQVLQTGGRTIRGGTARALNEFHGTSLHRRDWGRALEALKRDLQIPARHHGRILDTADYVDEAGNVLGNITDYL